MSEKWTGEPFDKIKIDEECTESLDDIVKKLNAEGKAIIVCTPLKGNDFFFNWFNWSCD